MFFQRWQEWQDSNLQPPVLEDGVRGYAPYRQVSICPIFRALLTTAIASCIGAYRAVLMSLGPILGPRYFFGNFRACRRIRLIASERVGKSGCFRRQSSSAASRSGGSLIAVTGSVPVTTGRPLFLRSIELVASYLPSSGQRMRRASASSRPAFTRTSWTPSRWK